MMLSLERRRPFFGLRTNRSDLSRSLHELAAPDLDNQSNLLETQPRLQSAINVSVNADNRPVVRRKRFTRRQRKSVTIEPETGLILAAGCPSSSEDEEKPPPKPTVRKNSPIRSQVRGLSASTFELSLDAANEEKQKRSRGPAARRAGRRFSRLRANAAASVTNLDRIDEGQRPPRRSLSVRDLNGEECDFRNQDSVTKWASQMLAELESLPCSRTDLSAVGHSPERPPVPPHRPEPPLSMSASTYLPWQPKVEAVPARMTSSAIFSSTWMTPLDNRVDGGMLMSSSFSSALSETSTRDRENSVGESTLKGSSTDSDVGTPVARSPVPEEEPISRPDNLKNAVDVGVQGPQTPLFASRARHSEEDSIVASVTTTVQVVMSPTVEQPAGKVRLVQAPVPAPRITSSNEGIVRLRKSVLESSQDQLMTGIARLSRTTGNSELLDTNPHKRFSETAIPTVHTSLYASQDDISTEDKLQKWKKKAECRARLEPPPAEKRSVSHVVASLIKSIEDSRLSAVDRPQNLKLSPQNVSTQTSPFTLSRSSSFDWMNEASEIALRDLKTPAETPRSPKPAMACGSSSETDEADREVTRLTSPSLAVPALAPKKELFAEMEESIAMLLQLGQDKPKRDSKQPAHFPVTMSESVYDNMGGRRRSLETPTDSTPSPEVPRVKREIQKTLEIPIGQRAGSCELLNEREKSPSSTQMKEKLKKAEEEALDSCEWLRKAGFPQYAEQYEAGQFPIDIRAAKQDHEFLESDSLRALFRRLDALNRCAIMRIDNVVLRRRNDNYPYDMYNMSDEDNVALSGNWRYQRNSHTWSRVGNEPMYPAASRVVSTQHGYRDPYAVKETRVPHYEERRLERSDNRTDESSSTSNKLQRSQSERIKDTAKAFMKKMNPRSTSRRRRESRPRDAAAMLISEPVLVSYDSASPEQMRMFPNITRPAMMGESRRQLDRPDRPQQRSRSTARRQGIVLLSSPESEESYRSSRLSTPRERSVPPPRARDAPYAPYERFRATAAPRATDDLFYSLQRAKPQLKFYDNSSYYGSSGLSSPAYSSPYSNRSFPTPPVRSRQLNVHPDGYYMHGSFEVSPDTSLSRPMRQYTSGPSTSTAALPQLQVDTLRAKSQSSLDNTDDEPPCSQTRRDSGVGSSLSRSPSGPSTQRIRQSVMPYSINLSQSVTSCSHSSNGSWNSTKRKIDRLMTSSLTSCISTDDTFFTDDQLLRCMDSLSAVQIARLRKMAYLRVTAMLEKYMGAGQALKLDSVAVAPSVASKNWSVQKLFRKIKMDGVKPVKEVDENTVFGQPLDVIYRRSGLSLPRTILEILRYLRQLAPDTVGIFRKNGVKSRIAELRQVCDRDADSDVFVDAARLDANQVHDVADLLKQFLRELPEPLMTTRLSEVFANIFIHVPENERTLCLQFAILLLPDENREALQTLLLFLSEVAKFSETNNMPAQNLSVCFTPSLFHLSAGRLDKVAPSNNRRHKTIGSAGMPTEREMMETRAAQACLTHMISHCREVFLTPETIVVDRSDCEDDAPLLKRLGVHGPRSYLADRIIDLIRENADRWKGWIVEGAVEGVEISSHKSPDGNPLRPWRVWTDVAAPPKEVLHRIMKERAVWDTSVVNWRSIDMQIAPDTDLHQFVLNDTVGHPTRDCYVVRFHRSDIPELRGACAVAERSVQCGETQLLGGVAAAVLDSRFLVEPKSGGLSRVTIISRIDLKGRGASWYGKTYGWQLAKQLVRLRESFRKLDEQSGPETKV